MRWRSYRNTLLLLALVVAFDSFVLDLGVWLYAAAAGCGICGAEIELRREGHETGGARGR